MQGATASLMFKDARVSHVGQDLTIWRRAILMAALNASALENLTIVHQQMFTGQQWR